MSIITVSSAAFGGDEALAGSIAERLGYECISREVYYEAARLYGIPAKEFLAVLDHPPSLWQRIARERHHYLDYVRAALCERAMNGDLIYYGHAGHLLLSGVSHVIRVRVLTGLTARIQAARERLRLDERMAAAYIKKADAGREKWVKAFYGGSGDDPRLYDLVLNLEQMSVSSASELVARMIELEEFRPTAQSVKAVRDLALGSRVRAVLSSDSRTTSAHVLVAADNGVVTITGTALTGAVVEAIPFVAAKVESVREVKCAVNVTWVHDSR